MCALDIRVELDGGKKGYRGGETLSGAVYVTAREPVECRSLTIELLWQAHGRGNSNVQTVDSQMQGSQRWQPGLEQRFPFRFQIPRSPWTYRGHMLNVDYHLVARADFPLARDVVADEEIVVLPGEPPEGKEQEATEAKEKVNVKNPLASLEGSIGATILLLAIAFLFTPIFLVLVLIVAARAVRMMLSERRLGKVQVSLRPACVSPGSSVLAQVLFPKTERVEVRSISATLVGKESCRYRSGRNRMTYNHTFHEEVVTLDPVGFNEFRGEITIPQTDAYTFKSGDNEISWEITMRVDVSNWPDWRKDYPIVVRPHFSSASDGQPSL